MMRRATQKCFVRHQRVQSIWLVVVAVCWVGVSLVAVEEALPPEQGTHLAYQQAKASFEKDAEDPQKAWKFGQCCFDWAEFATNDTQRASLAREGIAACETAVERAPRSAAAHFYLGMNLGQLARTMSLGALKLVNQMESHFLTARELDPEFAQAGPDRNLGLLYLQAPGWPVSVGNRSKARAHLRQAVELAPLFPENPLNLMEAYAQWNETDRLRRQLKDWEQQIVAAQKQFEGIRWQASWVEWEQRLNALKERITKTQPDLRSPRDRG